MMESDFETTLLMSAGGDEAMMELYEFCCCSILVCKDDRSFVEFVKGGNRG